jgi:hypothetical protein
VPSISKKSNTVIAQSLGVHENSDAWTILN